MDSQKDQKEIMKTIRHIISYFDAFKDQPYLNAKSYSKYKTKFGCFLTTLFIFIIFLLYLNAVISYFNLDHFTIQSKSKTYDLGSTRKSYISNKNMYAFVSFKSKSTGLEVNPRSPLTTFMKAMVIYYNLHTREQYQYAMQIRDCRTYFQQFKNSPNLRYCLTIPDRAQLFINSDPYEYEEIIIYFGFSCINLLLCSGKYYDSLFNQYKNFWVQNDYDIYFTTRQLDSNNKIEYIWNKFTSNQYALARDSVNYLSVGISNSTYYIDDSVLPWRKNKTYLLQTYRAQQSMNSIPIDWTLYYGVEVIFFSGINVYVTTKYYNKIDKLLGMLGGGIFIVYLIIRCFGNRYNRQRYQISLTNSLYVIKLDRMLEKISSLSLVDFIIFIPFKYLMMRRWTCLSNQYLLKLKNYQIIIQSSQYDTDVINLIKCSLKNESNLQLIKIIDKPKQIFLQEEQQVQQNQSFYTEQQIQKINLTGISQKYYQKFLNLNRKLKERYFRDNPLYIQVQNNNQPVQIIPKHSKIHQISSTSDFFSNLKRLLTYFDIFKVHPSFTLQNNQMHGTVFSFILTIIALILSVLTFYIGFQYFDHSSNPLLSVQSYNIPQKDIQISVNTNQNFKFGLCFINPNNMLVNQLSKLRTQMILQVIQYDRVGSESTINSQEMIPIKDMDYFDKLNTVLGRTYTNCYKPPDNFSLRIQGSPQDYVQSYFSFRLKQYCYQFSNTNCSLRKSINRQATLNILNKYIMEYFMTKSSYNVLQKSTELTFEQGLLFRQRGQLNSSVIEQILVGQFRLIEDKSKWSGTEIKKSSEITIEKFYSNNADILQHDNNDIFYELTIRASSRLNKFTLKNPKFDMVFGMIGGIFLFIFGFFGFFATTYNRFSQKMYIGNQIFSIKEKTGQKYQITSCKQWLYILLYPLKFLMKNNQNILKSLYNLKRIHNNIDEILSLQFLTRIHEIIKRQINGNLKNQTEKSLTDVYLKKQLDTDHQSNNRNQINNEDNQKKESLISQNNENKQQILLNQSKQQQKNKINKQMEQQKQNEIPQEQILLQSVKRKKISTSEKISNLIHKFLCNFDIFGTGGELSFQGSVKFGSWIGGILSLIAISLIIWIVYHFGNQYIAGTNYIVIKKVQTVSSMEYYQQFLGNKNFKFAVGFISSRFPNLANISTVTSKNLFNIMMIQSIINRTNPIKSTYSEIIYPLIPCPSNYLNDGTFSYYSFSIKYNIQNGYCLPDGSHLQFQGDLDSKIQKYFMFSIGINCTNPETCADNIIQGKQFFKNYMIRFFLSTPLINDYPLKYNFVMQPFMTVDPDYNQINNVTIDQIVYAQNNSIYWFNNPPNIKTYEYIYNANLQNKQVIQLDNNSIYFKNITFNPSYTRTTYNKIVTKIDQVFGQIGGIIGFIMFIFGLFVYQFNKFKLHYLIGLRLYKCKPQDVEVNDLNLYLFMLLDKINFRNCLSNRIPKLQKILNLIRQVKKNLNIVTYFKNTLIQKKLLSNLLARNDKILMDIYFKKVIQNFEQNDPPENQTKIYLTFVKQLQEILIKQYELSPYERMAIYNAIQNKYKLSQVLGHDAKRLEKYIKKEEELQERRQENQVFLNQNSELRIVQQL